MILIVFGIFSINLIENNNILYGPQPFHSVKIIPFIGPQWPYLVHIIPFIGPQRLQSVKQKPIIGPQCPYSVNLKSSSMSCRTLRGFCPGKMNM